MRQFGKKKTEVKDTIKTLPSHLNYLNKLFQKVEWDEKILADWLKELVDELDGDEGAIFLRDDDNLICKVTTGTTSLVEGRKISKKKGLGGWLFQSNKPTFIPVAKKDIRFDPSENIFDPAPESIVASPILFKEDTYGIIQINRKKPNNPFILTNAKRLFEISNILGFYLSYLNLIKRERKEEKKEKRLEEELSFSIVAHSIPIGFFIINEDLRILFVNNFALKTLGFQNDEAIGKKCREVIISNDKKGDIPLLDEILSKFPEKEYFQSPLHLLRKDGHEITVAFGASPFKFDGKNFAVLYFTNPAEWEMVYSKEDEFITNVAHELRTPLFAILGSLSILETELKRTNNLPPTIQSFLNIIREEGEKYTNILNALLDFDEVSKWNIGLKKDTFQILELVKKVAESYKQKSKEKNITIEVDFPPESIQISGDKLAIQYAFSHLIDNAIKFNKPEGTVIISTEGLKLRDSSWNFEIVIRDTGLGIPESEIPYLFGKFYRVEKEIHTISGFGLGLTIVKDIIDMHGGDITIESEVDKGTTVTIQLPTMEI
ncbi:MAG: PAS domain-containing protein [Candidatus Cloacimonadota bacterium]|nr:MAG: PAS domain-containing protein [Candidatus Cloacimonadota bacterium]